MTARAFVSDGEILDPSGMGGHFITRDESNAPDVVEIYMYPSDADFDAIQSGWHTAPRRERHLVLSVTIYKQQAGRLFVSVRMYVEPVKAPLRIDEPNV